MIAHGIVGKLLGGGRRAGQAQLAVPLDGMGLLGVNLASALRFEAARSNRRFSAINGNGSTFLAPIVALPTTVATMALYNPTADKAYVVEQLAEFLASGTPAAGGILLACVSNAPQAAPALSTGANGGYASTVIGSLSGAGASAARFVNAITLTPSAAPPVWVPVQSEPAAGVGATIGTHGLVEKVDGLFLIPPGGMLGLAYLSGAGTTPLFGFSAVWSEYDVELG